MNLAPIFMLQVFAPTFFDPTFTSLPKHKKDVEIKLEKFRQACPSFSTQDYPIPLI